jgi:hypothetical protein
LRSESRIVRILPFRSPCSKHLFRENQH